MTGMERNSEVCSWPRMRAAGQRQPQGRLCPTNLVIYDNSRYLAPCSTLFAV